MKLILKRGTEYTPIVFQNSTLQNKKCCRIEESRRNWIDIKNLFDLTLDIEFLQIQELIAKRQQTYPYRFNGGICRSEDRILALVVYKNSIENKFVIIEADYFANNPSYLARLKKSMNALDISSRTKLICWDRNKIYTEFQEIINPTMEDYSVESQKQLSNEFIISQRPIHEEATTD